MEEIVSYEECRCRNNGGKKDWPEVCEYRAGIGV